ncbi:SCO6880 family protein [Streptomyces cellulosae]|uniref:SCO6880 family protein n=1 Tax=Streptomyces cellulosae TaxID=1968 RepID=A0ABW7YJ22_STRCE
MGHPSPVLLEITKQGRPDTPSESLTTTSKGVEDEVFSNVLTSLQQDYRNALFNTQQSQIGQARDDAELTAARRTTEEQAQGHGVIRFGLLITAPVNSADELTTAAATVDNLAPAARIAVRPVYGSQAAAFAAALPLGLVLPLHTAVPQAH